MDDASIQAMCEKFLRDSGIPGFFVYGRKGEGDDWKVTYALHEMPPKTAIRGILTLVDQLVQQTLQ